MKRSTWLISGVALGALVGGLGAACDKSGSEHAPSPASAAPSAEMAPPAPQAMAVSLKATLAWGEVVESVDTSGPDVDAHSLAMDVAAGQPVLVRMPKGSKLTVVTPGATKVEPLGRGEYSFEVQPVTGKPTGFVFKTKPNLDRDAVAVEVKPAAKTGQYELSVQAGSFGVDKPQTVTSDCGDPGSALAAKMPNASRDVRAALAALSTELEQSLPRFEHPDQVMRVVTQAFDRSLVNVDRLRRAAEATPCGGGSLEFVCPRTTCVIRQAGRDQTMKKGDSLMLGAGTTVEFVSMRD